ncbi:MAG: penicillin-binding protein activator LpoB [Armatimonadetes bacterium]|nr:penicillin-binding protein activator LpoB [Armatimonadota bacterium]
MTTLRGTLIAVLLVVLALSTSGFAAGSKPRIILAPITDESTPEGGKQKAEGIPEAIRNALKDALFQTGKFTLIADSDMQKDLDSERYNQYVSGDFDPTQAAAIGRKVGAQALVRCKVVTNQLSARVKDLILVKETEFTMQLAVSVEICDIEKTVICFMHTASTEQKTKSKVLTLDSETSKQNPISLSNPTDVRGKAVAEIAKELAAKISANAAREKGKGSVVSVKGNGKADDAIVVDIGASAGADVDCELAILGVDEDGFEEVIGKAKVTNTQEEKSKAVITETKRAVVAGDAVQLKGGGSSGSSGSSGFAGGGGGDAMNMEVIAVGEGTSRDAAINDALVQAIQQAAGVYIMSEEEGRNYESVKNEVFSQTKGFISKYDVINDSNDGGVAQVKVKALVSNKPVYNALLARKIVSRQRVMVCVPEQHLKLVVPDPAGETEEAPGRGDTDLRRGVQ